MADAASPDSSQTTVRCSPHCFCHLFPSWRSCDPSSEETPCSPSSPPGQGRACATSCLPSSYLVRGPRDDRPEMPWGIDRPADRAPLFPSHSIKPTPSHVLVSPLSPPPSRPGVGGQPPARPDEGPAGSPPRGPPRGDAVGRPDALRGRGHHRRRGTGGHQATVSATHVWVYS